MDLKEKMSKYPKKFVFMNREHIANNLDEEISIIKMIKLKNGELA